MKFLNPSDDTPPFNQWIFLDMGDYFTFGKILKISPNDEYHLSEYKSFERGEFTYEEYQFFIQDMTEIDEVRDYFDSDCLSDSIKWWAVRPY